MPAQSRSAPRGRTSVGQQQSRRAAPTPRSPRGRAARGPAFDAPRGTAVACLFLGPIVGAVLGDAVGSYSGPVFAVLCVLSAMVAVATVRPTGLWWVLPAPPPVIWAVGVLAELSWHNPPYQGSKDQAVGIAHGTIHTFPVMVAAELAMGAVLLVLRARAGQRRSVHA